MSRFIDFYLLKIDTSVKKRNVQRFLDLLKNSDNIVSLWFRRAQPQELFNRLSEHCAVQKLIIKRPSSDLDFQFLFRLKHLVELYLDLSSLFPDNAFTDPIEPIDFELIRRILEELEFLFKFRLTYCDKKFEIQIGHSNSKRSFVVSCAFVLMVSECSDPNTVIKFIKD